ncbi:MAG: signal peptidase II [Candidatus Acidiferrales bacterium]
MAGAARSRWLALGAVALGALAADQWSKHAVEKYTAVGSLRVLIPGMLNMVHTSNAGVAFGLFADSDNPWRGPLLIAFSAAVIAMLLWLLAAGRAGGRCGEFGLALILGGALGNLLDRFQRHSVTDFIDFHIASHHWYTFNLADSAIVLGAALVVLELFRDTGHPSQENA